MNEPRCRVIVLPLLLLLAVASAREAGGGQRAADTVDCCAAPVPVTTVEPVVSPLVYRGGTVVVQVFVDRTGRVTNVRVVTPVPALVEPVVAALKQWRFQPALANGRPMDSCATIAVHVSLVREVV